MRPVAILLAILLTGAVLAGLRTGMRIRHAAAIPALDTQGEAVRIEGWLAAIDTSASGRSRLLVRVPPDGDRPGYRIRVLAAPGPVQPGDAVSVRAVLEPPRMAIVPGGYDFAFHAFFSGIAATGYAIAPAERGPELGGEWVQRRIAALRWTMAERIAARISGRSGALAAALLTGDRSRLDAADVEALRAAGLGHMLAISGMHMGLFAGGVFFAVRLAAAGFGRWSRGHDPAVPAALAALLAGAIYLVLSGHAIPTQRAYIMTASALGAVIARRRVLSFHTLAIAMTAVLLVTPEAVVTPGFQMSFAAVAALIAAAQAWQVRRPPPSPLDPARGIRQFFGGLGMTSLVAGLATSGFAAFHFHRVAAWGLAGNLLVMPVFTLVVMPAGVLALFLMPLGLDALPLAVMGAGLDLVLSLAHTVAGWPGAERAIPSAPGWVLPLYATGFAAACTLRRRARWGGAGVILMAFAAWALADRPDLFVTRDGVVVVREGEGGGWAVSDRAAQPISGAGVSGSRGEPRIARADGAAMRRTGLCRRDGRWWHDRPARGAGRPRGGLRPGRSRHQPGPGPRPSRAGLRRHGDRCGNPGPPWRCDGPVRSRRGGDGPPCDRGFGPFALARPIRPEPAASARLAEVVTSLITAHACMPSCGTDKRGWRRLDDTCGSVILADQTDEPTLHLDPVGSENAGFVFRIGGF